MYVVVCRGTQSSQAKKKRNRYVDPVFGLGRMPRLLAFLWWWAILLALLLHLSPAPVGAAVPRQHVRHEDEKAEEEEAGEGGGGGDVKGDDDDGVFGGGKVHHFTIVI